MVFGVIPVADAEGAVLAHTLRLPGGGTIVKGRPLTRADIALLLETGTREIIAARVGSDDVSEDSAAAAIAATLAGPGLEASAAVAGRVSLRARERGVAVIDRDTIDRVNSIDESVAVATVEPWSIVEGGAIAATIKVIPFAVPRALVDRAQTVALCDKTAIDVAPLQPVAAGLIVTQTGDRLSPAQQRAADAQRLRLTRLGGRVLQEIRCAHDADAIAAAIRSLVVAGCSPVLILGVHATADRRDVVPAAIGRVGGYVERLGVPIDPGHFLLIGRCDAVPILGLPGCARSAKRGSLDVVLRHIATRTKISHHALARLGVGGLLYGDGTAAHACDTAEALHTPPAAAIVLAAGLSRRNGAANKLLETIAGAPVICRVVDTVLASRARPLVVVTGHEAEAVRAVLRGREVVFVHNNVYEEGLSGSVRTGVAALADSTRGALLCLGDMPLVRAGHLDALIAEFDASDGRAICVPMYGGQRGNPVLWPAAYFEQLLQLAGDVGARALLQQHADAVRPVAIDDDGVTLDIDTPDMLAAARARY